MSYDAPKQRRRRLAILAILAAFWLIPIGLGYLILRRWARFGLAVVFQLLGQALLRPVIGPEPAAIVTAVVWLITIADTWRLAMPHIKAGS